jgi:RNA polymerase sigma-70 factor (ECF subfamily)
LNVDQRSPAPRAARDAQCIAAFRAHFDFVHRVLRRYGAGPADLDDLVQEVFVAMWVRWEEFDARRPLRPWLAGIAFRMARHNLRRRQREVPDGTVDPEDPLPHGEDTVADAQARALVLDALGRLPDKYRMPLVLHDLDELTAPEVARTLAVPLATVYTRLRRARLAFARVVTELQAARAGSALAVRTAQALLALERQPSAAPESARRRALARMRAVMALPLPPPRPTPAASGGLVTGLAVASAVSLVALVLGHAGTVTGADRVLGQHVSQVAPPAPVAEAVPRLRLAARPAIAIPRASLPAQGLVGRWSFEDDPGSGLAGDSSGHGRHCRVHGAGLSGGAAIAGPRGRALQLEGGAWLECPLPDSAAGEAVELTVALWVRRASLRTPAALVTRQLAHSFQDQFFFGFGGDGLRVVSHAWSGWAVDPDPPAPGRWFHAAFTHDRAGNTRLFVDGVQVAHSAGRVLDPRAVAAPGTIGAGRYGAKPQLVRQRFEGSLDEIAIYDRALAPGEVAALSTR